MTPVITFVFAALGLALLYGLPGWVFLRRSGIDGPTRVVLGVALSYGATTAVLLMLDAIGSLNRASVIASIVVMVAVAVAVPLRPGAVEPLANPAELTGPLLGVGVIGVATVVQAVRPAVFRLPDAVSFWAPLADDIATSGTLTPDWIPTVIEGFPRSVGLVAGSISLLWGGFEEMFGYLAHPMFAWALLATVVLLAGGLGGRRAAWIALLTMVATPLLARGVFFHDDLLTAFLIAIVAVVAVRAGDRRGWAVAGFVAGSAIAVKHLGVVGILLLAALLLARRAPSRAWFGAAAATVIGLPWYVGNIVRYGNPVHPLLPSVFGESESVRRALADHDGALEAFGKGSIWEIGLVALAAVGVGGIAALWRARRESDELFRISLAIVGTAIVFTAVWQATPFATRHVIGIFAVLAALGGYGLGGESQDHRRFQTGRIAVVALFLLVAAVTVIDVQMDLADDDLDAVAQSGAYTLLVGKWGDLDTGSEPPEDLLELHGRQVSGAWRNLQVLDPEPSLFSFDTRTFYFPQDVLVANDVRAFPIYEAGAAQGQHAALLDAGVGYVLDRRSLGERHPLFAEGPWEDLEARPDLYDPILITNNVRLYAVLPAG